MKKEGVVIEVSIPVVYLKEGTQITAYSPVLEVASSGDTLGEAQENFVEAVQIFFEETMELGTTEEVLEEMGWQRTDRAWAPPQMIGHTDVSVPVPA